MRWIVAAVGVLVGLVGLLWTLQGMNLVTGSFMSGQKMWLVIGLVVLVAGVSLAMFGLRRFRRA